VAGNIYDDALEELETEQAPPAANPFDDTLRLDETAGKQRLRGAMVQAAETTPDRAADVRRLSARTGVAPEAIERDYDTFSKRGTVDAVPYQQIQAETPKLAAWLEKPENAKLASDDIEPLRVLAKTLDVGTNALRALAAGPLAQFTVGAWDTAATAAEWLGADSLAGWFTKASVSAARDAEYARGAQARAGPNERAFYSGFESVGGMAPGALLGGLSGSANAMLTVMGIQSGGTAAQQARKGGAGLVQATGFGALQGTVEALTEKIPAAWFFADLAKGSPFYKILLHQLASELPGEQVATHVQDFNEWAILHPDQSPNAYLESRPAAFMQTLIASVTMVGTMATAGKVAQSLAGDGGRAKRAELDQEFFKELASGVKGSKTFERSPEGVQALVADLTKDGPIANVYAPVDTFETYWQDKELETPHGTIKGAAAIAGELTGRADALEEARRSGVDLEIPTAVYAVQLAGTPHHAFMAEELRLGSPDRMNARELTAFREAETAKADEPTTEELPAPNPIRQEIIRKIQAAVAGTKIKLPPGAIEGYADVFEALTATFEREGLDPVETLQRYGLLVTGPQEGHPTAPQAAGAAIASPAPVAQASPPVPLKERIAALRAEQDAIQIAKLKTNMRAVTRMSETDPFTGLANLRALNKALPKAEADPDTQVIAFDANNFGHVNKTEGDPAGDAVILQIAEAIQQAAKQFGVGERVFRRREGGDEFVVLAPKALGDQIQRRAATIFGRRPVKTMAGETVFISLTGTSGNTFTEADSILQAAKTAAKALDTSGLSGQTEGAPDAAAEPLPSRRADQGGLSQGQRVPASDPGTNQQAGDKHLARVFDALLASARALDPAVVQAALQAEFDYRLELWLDRQTLEVESGQNQHLILKAIARLGGIAISADTAGELRDLQGRFGTVVGVPSVRGVFRTKNLGGSANKKLAGHGIDVMLQMLQGDPQFAYLASIDQLRDVLDEVSRHGASTVSNTELPGTEELRDVGIRQDRSWWTDAWRTVTEPNENPDDLTADATGVADFDVSTLDQVVTLFQDAPEEPTAAYVGEQEDGAGGSVSLYTITGGPRHQSTVTEETLTALGIATPAKELEPALPGIEGFGGTAAELGEVPFRLTAQIVQTSNARKLQRTLFQEETPPAKKKLGGITARNKGDWERNAFFGPDLQFTIKLFENADVSTFLHESAHLFLKIMTDLEARPEATASLKNDLAIIRTRYGPDGVEQHEKFARAFEAYLLEGKAPSLALRTVFANFRKWLGRVYRTLNRLNADLTDDVRDVFDRMLASDAAIAEAQAAVTATPMFTTAESARMSQEEFAVYQGQIADAGRLAREELEGKLLRDLQRQQRADYKAEKQAIRETVETEVYAMPVYQALAAMRKGTRPDGTPLVEGAENEPLKLSRAIIRDRYGKERLAALPSYPPPIHTADGGMDPDTVAELFGFASGDALLTAVAEALPMRGLIEAETTKRMDAQAGDLMVETTLSDLAKAAVANEHREAIVRIEMQTLGRLRRTAQAGAVKERDYERRWFEAEAKLRIAIAEGRKQNDITALEAEVADLKKQARGGAARINAALPSEADLRDVARARIGRTRIKDLKPMLFWTAARRAGEQATAHAARQDFDKALGAKQQELVSLALYREATRVVEDVEARVKAAQKLDQPSSRQRIGLAGASYQDQIDAILDRYEFASISGKALRKRLAMRAWIVELEKDGMAPDFPEAMIDDARQVHHKELTVDELTDVSDTLKSIVHLAQLKNRLLANLDEREFAVERDKLVTSIREHNEARPVPLEFRPADDRRRSFGEWFASHARIGTLAQVMDGPGDGGAAWSAIVRPINTAADAKQSRNAAEGTAYAAIMAKHYPGRELGRWHEQMHIPAIGASLSKEARLAVALNSGNQTSRDRLVNDPRRKWNQQQVDAILATLDARDWAYVVDTWRFLDRFWPEIAAKTKRLTGVEPERVEGIPVLTKFGTFQGGYYPLAYDARMNIQSQQHEAVTEAKLQTSAAYVRTTTRRGHLEARVQNVKLSVRLDLGVMFAHLEQVIHDLTHHEMLIDVTRLLRDPAVSNAILETKGDVVYKQFTKALEAIAEGKLDPGKSGENWATFARTSTQIALLGFNFWTGVQQPLGLFNGMERVGAKWVARGLGRWLKDAATMQKTTTWIDSVSPFMAERGSTATQDLADLRGQMRTSGGWFDTLVRTVTLDTVTQQHVLDSFLWHIGVMQRVADVPTWLGQYEKSMAAGEPEARAISLADQAVIDSQGSGRISDLAQKQRGGPIAKLFLMFYSYGSATYNATYRRAGQTDFKSPTQVTRFLAAISLIYLVPSMASVALSRVFGKSGDDDDDDDWQEYIADVGRETLASALNGMVAVRELSQIAADGTRGYAGPAGTRVAQMLLQLAGQAKQGELDEALAKALLQVGGVFARFPTAQLQRTYDGWAALQADETDNPAALLVGPPR